MNIDFKLEQLSKSTFRNKFKLTKKDIEYVNNKGLETIRKHAYDFITKRLAKKDLPNDGKQTPMRGHPVFISQHATATCCRSCLYKWHHIQMNKELTDDEINYVVSVIMRYIEKQV